MSLCRKSVAALAAWVVIGQCVQRAPASDAFEGAYVTTFTPDEDGTDDGVFVFKDSVLFHSGLLSADAISMYGFAPAAYTVNVTEFTVTLVSDAQGTMKWTGRRGLDGIVGTLVWTKPDGRVVNYRFEGTPTAAE